MNSLLTTAELTEQKQIQRIVYNYYCEQCATPQQAFDEYKKLSTFIKQHPETTRLVRFGQIVFALKNTASGMEFHSLGRETTVFAYIKDLQQLVDYVVSLNISAMYSYSNDRVFELVQRRIQLNFTKDIQVAPDGATYNYYRLEF